MQNQHEPYMHRCLQLAAKGLGRVRSNPLVGSVLVYHDRIIGEGYHEQYGSAHAEINCLHSVAEEDKVLIPESTLYVNLEPCCHTGKTPPCTSALLAHQIKHVVIANQDPFPSVNGKGIDLLREAGVEVTVGILDQEAKDLNKRFFCFHQEKKPYVILKWAESADGFIGKPNERVQISNALSQYMVHQWRREEAAIWVGYQTALTDNPFLTVRLVEGENPTRIIYDADNSLPPSLNLFQVDSNVLRFSSNKYTTQGDLLVSSDHWAEDILANLYTRGIASVIIEGGARLLQHMIDRRLWHEARVFSSTSELKNGIPSPQLHGAICVDEKKITDNKLGVYVAAR